MLSNYHRIHAIHTTTATYKCPRSPHYYLQLTSINLHHATLCRQTDGQTQPNSSSHQPNQVTRQPTRQVPYSSDFLDFVSNLGAQKGNTLLGGVMHEVSKGEKEMEAVDGVDCRGEGLAHAPNAMCPRSDQIPDVILIT
jgi:hypothetical protein